MLAALMLCIGLLSLVSGFILEGGHLASLLSPTSAIIVLGGTLGAVGLSFSGSDLKKIPKSLAKAFKSPQKTDVELIDYFKQLSLRIKKEGFLIIEQELQKDTQNLGKIGTKGLQLALDGVDPEMTRKILEETFYAQEEEEEVGVAIFEAAGGYSPTMGIAGTVMGLVHILGNLSKPETLGPLIAAGFIATLYGIGSANVLFLPIASKLKVHMKAEARRNLMIIEAISCIQEGANSAIVEERLKSIIGE